jgi:hypothetical protein
MNKLTIPAILAATVLIAGMFVILPIEKASTTHRAAKATPVTLAPNSITAETIAAGSITASEAPNLDVAISSRASSADIDTQDRFMTINIPAGASSIGSTAITLSKTDGYSGFATIVAVVTTSQAGKNFKLEADTDGDGVADTDVVSVSLSSTGTKIATGSIPNGTDRLFISSAGANSAAFGASVTIQFDSIIP